MSPPTDCALVVVVGTRWTAVVGWIKFLPFKLSLGFEAVNFVFEFENHTGFRASFFAVVLVVGKISGLGLGISVTGTESDSSFLSFFTEFLTKVALSCILEVAVPLRFFAALMVLR